jgi:hypothetical protein
MLLGSHLILQGNFSPGSLQGDEFLQDVNKFIPEFTEAGEEDINLEETS